jgi:hypothetical protein
MHRRRFRREPRRENANPHAISRFLPRDRDLSLAEGKVKDLTPRKMKAGLLRPACMIIRGSPF